MNAREIKFRAWVPRHKRMYTPGNDVDALFLEMYSNGDIQVGVHREEPGDTFHEGIREVELMQFTGLKDKNGVDVYEGDYVKTDNGKLFQVFSLDFYISTANTPKKIIERGEAVGNCYENQNLLNELK